MPRFLIPAEGDAGETRVAATPDTVKKILSLGGKVSFEKGAGLMAGFIDKAYESAGAELVPQGDREYWRKADILLCVQPPLKNSLLMLRKLKLLVLNIIIKYIIATLNLLEV